MVDSFDFREVGKSACFMVDGLTPTKKRKNTLWQPEYFNILRRTKILFCKYCVTIQFTGA
jgi:hypothetical protein